MKTQSLFGGWLRLANFPQLVLLMVIGLLTGCETPTAVPSQEITGEIFELKDLDQAPKISYQQRPRYPEAMRRAGVAGETMIRFVVDPEGKVRDARCIKATHPDFAAAAVEAASGWKFKPGIKNGRAVNTRMELPLTFSINERQ